MVGGGVNTAGCLRTVTPRFQGNLNFKLVKYVVCEKLCTWLNTLLAYVLLLACANMPVTKCFAAGLRWKCFSNVSFILIHGLFTYYECFYFSPQTKKQG